MKNIRKMISAFLLSASVLMFTGCEMPSDIVEDTTTEVNTNTNTTDNTTEGTTSLVSLSLTDAPVDDENISGVYMTFTGIRYEYANADEGWQDLELEAPITLNLLDLQDGKVASLGTKGMKPGVIEHIRFVLDTDNCYLTLKDDPERKVPMTIPSGAQTGVKSTNGFIIAANNGETKIIADFDVRKSLTLTGKGEYKMKPTIRLYNRMAIGTIGGTVQISSEYPVRVVYVYDKGTWVDGEVRKEFSGATGSSKVKYGKFYLPWVEDGKHDLVVVGYDNLGGYENIIGFIPNIELSPENGLIFVEINDETLVDSL